MSNTAINLLNVFGLALIAILGAAAVALLVYHNVKQWRVYRQSRRGRGR